MSDKELLQLAANACGIKWQIGVYGSKSNPFFRWKNNDNPNCTIISDWNPLESNEDAFKLASTLMLTVEFGNNCVIYPDEFIGLGTDALAATRRAIVMAAADIGKSL